MVGTDLQDLYTQLGARRRARCLPPQIREHSEQFIEDVLGLLFPHFCRERDCSADKIEAEVQAIEARLNQMVSSVGEPYPSPAPDFARQFLDQLSDIVIALELDATAIYHGDPAAVSVDEVILAYPGFFAIAVHRIAHCLYRLQAPLVPRLLAEHAHRRTGIDIHPGATIGRSFAIDHGTGIVIGETTEIGNGVKLYQGVTLGAISVAKQLASKKRHPTLEDHVVVYAGATILGGETVIGHDTIVGGNAWVTHSVAPFSVVGRFSEVHRREEIDETLEFNI